MNSIINLDSIHEYYGEQSGAGNNIEGESKDLSVEISVKPFKAKIKEQQEKAVKSSNELLEGPGYVGSGLAPF